MEAKELMIGDWVECDTLYPRQVQITMQDLLWISQGKVANPIPLTPEILKLNGFVYNGLHYTKVYKAFRHVLVIIDADLSIIEINFIDAYGTDDEECVYASLIELDKKMSVHEVQHALRLCGLNDLADNFKV